MIFQNGNAYQYTVNLMEFNGYSSATGLNINAIGLTYFKTPQIRGFKTYTIMFGVRNADVITGIDLGVISHTVTNNIPSFFKLKGLVNADFTTNIYPTNPTGYKDFNISFGGNALDYTGYVFDNITPYINNRVGDNFWVQKFILLCRN